MATTLFWLNVIVFLICLVIQFRALNRKAFGRAIFITIAMFFFTFIVFIAPDAPRALVWIIFVLTWLYTLFMTSYSISRIRLAKKFGQGNTAR